MLCQFTDISAFKGYNVSIADHSGWYKRSENNGWRLVSDRLIHHIMSDPVTWESSQKKYEYSHDKVNTWFLKIVDQ